MTRVIAVRLPLMGGILVNPESPLGRRLCKRHDQLSWQAAMDRRSDARDRAAVAREWASYR